MPVAFGDWSFIIGFPARTFTIARSLLRSRLHKMATTKLGSILPWPEYYKQVMDNKSKNSFEILLIITIIMLLCNCVVYLFVIEVVKCSIIEFLWFHFLSIAVCYLLPSERFLIIFSPCTPLIPINIIIMAQNVSIASGPLFSRVPFLIANTSFLFNSISKIGWI